MRLIITESEIKQLVKRYIEKRLGFEIDESDLSLVLAENYNEIVMLLTISKEKNLT